MIDKFIENNKGRKEERNQQLSKKNAKKEIPTIIAITSIKNLNDDDISNYWQIRIKV